MQWVVPFAAASAEAAREAIARLELPALAALLAHAEPAWRDDGDEWSLSPPHERALARAWGWTGGDGLLPFAARAALADGIEPLDLAWGLLTPAHWQVGADQLRMLDPAALQLGADESRALFDAVRPLFEAEGHALAWGAPLRWYAAHESLAELATASLDRVIGRGVERWTPGVRTLSRMQNEVQMVLHGQAVNERREAAGAPAVNSFWLSGCGRHQPARGEATLDDGLRASALADDWAAWIEAWRALDAGLLARLRPAFERGDADTTLVLCGERNALALRPQPRRWWHGLSGRKALSPAAVLQSL